MVVGAICGQCDAEVADNPFGYGGSQASTLVRTGTLRMRSFKPPERSTSCGSPAPGQSASALAVKAGLVIPG